MCEKVSNFSSARISPGVSSAASPLPFFMNCTRCTLYPLPHARSAVPSAAVVFPLPLPQKTWTSPGPCSSLFMNGCVFSSINVFRHSIHSVYIRCNTLITMKRWFVIALIVELFLSIIASFILSRNYLCIDSCDTSLFAIAVNSLGIYIFVVVVSSLIYLAIELATHVSSIISRNSKK